MPRLVRWTHVLTGTLALWSALVVLLYDLTLPGYATAHGDVAVLVAAYALLQVGMLAVFLRRPRGIPWVAVAKTAAALAFVAAFAIVGPFWMARSPARYVYALFDFRDRPELKIVLMAYVFLGRGAWNVVSAFVLTEAWWRPLRGARPLLGRAVTAGFAVLLVGSVWAFFELVRMDAKTFSPEAHEVARFVFQTLECERIRSRAGTESTDVRQHGAHRYEVAIRYGCEDTRVVVRAADGRIGTARGPRRECCSSGA